MKDVKVVYRKKQFVFYKKLESFLGVCLNTMFGFILALTAFSFEMPVQMKYAFIIYGMLSLTYTVWVFPDNVDVLQWLLQCPDKEITNIVRVDAKSVSINGVCWDIVPKRAGAVVVDCCDGIAYIPMNILERIKYSEN